MGIMAQTTLNSVRNSMREKKETEEEITPEKAVADIFNEEHAEFDPQAILEIEVAMLKEQNQELISLQEQTSQVKEIVIVETPKYIEPKPKPELDTVSILFISALLALIFLVGGILHFRSQEEMRKRGIIDTAF